MTKPKIKMIGLDLDGTLLTDKKELTSYTREVLQKAIAKGVVVLVATGRPYSGIPKELLDFPGMRYVLTTNGARIIDQEEGKVIYESCMGQDVAAQVLDLIHPYDAIQEFFMDGNAYCRQESWERVYEFFQEPYMADYIRNTRMPAEDLKKQMVALGKPVDKIHVIFKDMEERKDAIRRLQEIPGLFVTGAFPNSLEINQEGTSKGLGLLLLGERLGITREEIMACGDGMNDYDMLEKVGFGVAMANGNPKLKEIAAYVTVSNEEDGVAKAIEKFVLEE